MSMIFPIQNGTDIVTAEDINKRPMAPVERSQSNLTISYGLDCHSLNVTESMSELNKD